MKRLQLSRADRGLVITGVFMVICYCVFALVEVFLLGGHFEIPRLVFLPFWAVIFSTLAFWGVVVPARWMGRILAGHWKLPVGAAVAVAAALCGALGIIFGVLNGGREIGLMWGFYGVVSGLLFSLTTAPAGQPAKS